MKTIKPDKMLANTKVYVAEKSEAIQKKAFDLGYGWPRIITNELKKEINNVAYSFLFFNENGEIMGTGDFNEFMNNEFRELTANEVLTMGGAPISDGAPAPNWEQRRYEIAKDCLAQRINGEQGRIMGLIQGKTESEATSIVKQIMEALIKSSVVYADELIKQLKGGGTE